MGSCGCCGGASLRTNQAGWPGRPPGSHRAPGGGAAGFGGATAWRQDRSSPRTFGPRCPSSNDGAAGCGRSGFRKIEGSPARHSHCWEQPAAGRVSTKRGRWHFGGRRKSRQSAEGSRRHLAREVQTRSLRFEEPRRGRAGGGRGGASGCSRCAEAPAAFPGVDGFGQLSTEHLGRGSSERYFNRHRRRGHTWIRHSFEYSAAEASIGSLNGARGDFVGPLTDKKPGFGEGRQRRFKIAGSG